MGFFPIIYGLLKIFELKSPKQFSERRYELYNVTFKLCDAKIVNEMNFLKIINLYRKKITMDMNINTLAYIL